MNPQSCTSSKTFNCRVFQKLQQLRNPNSPHARLANSTNDSVRELLRSMVGDATGADPRAREVLIANGILAQTNGSFVEQPPVAERHPEYLARFESDDADGPSTAATAGQEQRTQPPERTAERTPASQDAFTFTPPINNPAAAAPTRDEPEPDLSDVVRDPEDLREVQEELRRRLAREPNGQVADVDQARRVVRDAFRSQNQTITPAQEVRVASDLLGARPAAPPAPSVLDDMPAPGPNRAGVSGGPSQLQHWRNNRMNEALMGMAGARGQTAADLARAANANQERELTRVALNIGDDSRVTLADLLNTKISDNDPDTQLLKVLLRNNNNFVLQVRQLNFRIQFDGQRNFNLLLESGDQREAERLRPQLELFLRRLRA